MRQESRNALSTLFHEILILRALKEAPFFKGRNNLRTWIEAQHNWGPLKMSGVRLTVSENDGLSGLRVLGKSFCPHILSIYI